MSSSGLYFFRGFTLVDITATGVTRSKEQDDLKRNQQRNWETVLQCIGLRAQPHYIDEPSMFTSESIELGNFGDMYRGHNHNVWTWTWAVESAGVYDLPNDPLGGLQQDFEQVPIICGLTETARFMLPIFYPHGGIKNIHIISMKMD
jgi:hypothetical protein